jgi:hypothetical protein
MDSSPARRPAPFLVTLAIALVVSVAVFRLPEEFVASLRRHRPLGNSGSDWVYRLISVAAVMQALYVGLALLRPERVQEARRKDPKLARMARSELLHSVSRNAAAIAALTLVYGLSAFFITGERGAYWLFVVLLIAQVALYYRQVGAIESWLSFQPEYVTDTNEHLALGQQESEAEAPQRDEAPQG